MSVPTMAQMKLKPYWIYEFLSRIVIFLFFSEQRKREEDEAQGRYEAPKNLRITFLTKYQQQQRQNFSVRITLSEADFLAFIRFVWDEKESKKSPKSEKKARGVGEHNKWIQCD